MLNQDTVGCVTVFVLYNTTQYTVIEASIEDLSENSPCRGYAARFPVFYDSLKSVLSGERPAHCIGGSPKFHFKMRLFNLAQDLTNFFCHLKGIVSRDWGELQMIPVDSLEVFSIAGSYFYFFLTTLSCLN